MQGLGIQAGEMNVWGKLGSRSVGCESTSGTGPLRQAGTLGGQA
jgi:hypothetical protein